MQGDTFATSVEMSLRALPDHVHPRDQQALHRSQVFRTARPQSANETPLVPKEGANALCGPRADSDVSHALRDSAGCPHQAPHDLQWPPLPHHQLQTGNHPALPGKPRRIQNNRHRDPLPRIESQENQTSTGKIVGVLRDGGGCQ